MQKKIFREYSLLQIILGGVIATGFVFALYQYFYNRSLWLDEASLAQNIIDRSFLHLLKPLKHNQIAPIGFLMVEKFFTVLFGNNELALRLFPLLGFCASIPLFFIMSSTLTRSNTLALLCTGGFAVTYRLIYYASEVKQYSTDVLITILLIAITVSPRKRDMKYLVYCTAIGSIAIWFSNVAVIIAFVCGFYLLIVEVYRHRKFQFLIPPLVWALSFGVYYVKHIYHHPTTEYMQRYWGEHFLPLNPFSEDFYLFLYRAIPKLYHFLLGFGNYYWVAVLISIVGLLYALRQKRYVLLYFCCTPIFINLILSGLRLYPFSERLILYLTPFFVLLYSAGIYALFRIIQRKIPALPDVLVAVPVIVMLIAVASKLPLEQQEIKKTIAYIDQRIKPGEKIYVYNMAQRALPFYQTIGFTQLKEDQIIKGTRQRDQIHNYDQELLSLSGNVWMLFSHVYTLRPGYTEEDYMMSVLLSNGGRIIEKLEVQGSSCYYIDTGKPFAN